MNDKLEILIDNCRAAAAGGQVATYIPELAGADPMRLGIFIKCLSGEEFHAGDCSVPFTIQSVSKIVLLLCALLDSDSETFFKKVSLEPTSDGFNSIVNLETKNKNRPLNPLINSGAITMVTLIEGNTGDEKFSRIFNMIRTLSGNPNLSIDEKVFRSESETGSRNRSLAYYLHSTGIISGNVEEILRVYFRICSVIVTAKDLANIAAVFAGGGVLPDGRRLFPEVFARQVKATMSLCGMYDESGKFAVEVGLPSKSGVGGGILSAVPGKMGIGVYGPSLNEKGSSIAGIELLRQLSEAYDLSIYTG